MHTILATNVNDALPRGLEFLRIAGRERPSRNGLVLVAPCPVTTFYQKPWQRVLFSTDRNANPFFHLFESVWMLAGRKDVAPLAAYVSRMRTFSDNGEEFHGAYGWRWRNHFDRDQLLWIVSRLQTDFNDRRTVLQMYDANVDQPAASHSKDIPCNTHIYPWINVDGELAFTLCNRSNDIIWGAYGANAVHFSVLQEVLASAIGVPMGPLWQISNNFHAYVDLYEKHKHLAQYDPPEQVYGNYQPIVLGAQSLSNFLLECEYLIDSTRFTPSNEWLRETVRPAILAHEHYRAKNFTSAYRLAAQIASEDWSEACHTWLQRREAALERAKDDGVDYET